MVKLSDIDWGAIRIDWENGNSPFELSKRYDVSMRLIANRAYIEGWVKRDIVEIEKENKVFEINRKEKFKIRDDESINEMLKNVTNVKRSHKELARNNMLELERLLTDMKGNKNVSLYEKADLIKKMSEAAKICIGIERELYGLSRDTEVSENDVMMQVTDDPLKAAEVYKKMMG